MSCITDSNTLENAFQPSLVYPSLTSYSEENGEEIHDKTDMQLCIHFASRLIKLRSELRSSSYMSSSISLQLLKPSSITTSPRSLPSSSSSVSITERVPKLTETLNKIGRVNSLPNFNQYRDDGFDNISFMDKREDESEIMDRLLPKSGKLSTSQLTHLTDIIRQSMRQRQCPYSQGDQFYLALPPKSSLHNQNKIANSLTTSPVSNYQNSLQKSTSLRDVPLSQDEVKPQQQKKEIPTEKVYCQPNDYPTFSLVSQLASASTAHTQGERNKKKKQNENDFPYTENISTGRARETSLSSIKTLSTSYESDDDSETESEVLLRHAVPATAFLVSLSPSAAAAASAARFRRRRPILHDKR